jgi:signal transduction histidine kinase
VVVSERAGAAEPAARGSRRLTLLTGLALLFAVVLAGGQLIARSVARELAVARLQSDFVAAVSHEFRTPLTSLLQFTTALREDDALSAVKRHAFYDAQARAARRLAHLVESLLDFGRMKAGAHPYRMGRVNAPALVAELTDEFQRETAAAGFALEYSADATQGGCRWIARRLSGAVRNLLENARKYSGAGRRIVVHVTERLGLVAIRVRDEGLRVPRHEQRQMSSVIQ